MEAPVARAPGVIVTTVKPDKYDRYLSDIFLEAASDPGGGIFLNNALLEKGHAARKDSYVPGLGAGRERSAGLRNYRNSGSFQCGVLAEPGPKETRPPPVHASSSARTASPPSGGSVGFAPFFSRYAPA